MSAELFPTYGPFKFQAWCDLCKDGRNGSRDACETWVSIHNKRNHQEPPA